METFITEVFETPRQTPAASVYRAYEQECRKRHLTALSARAFYQRLLAVYLTFDPPSYRSVIMVLRICVQRFERLPQCIVVDGGREFHSVYFDSLLARYRCTKKTRPWVKPHFGSVIERLFNTTHEQFIYTLLGNTQAAKRARLLTRAVDPGPLHLPVRVCPTWVYDQNEHSSLGRSPQTAYLWGMKHGTTRVCTSLSGREKSPVYRCHDHPIPVLVIEADPPDKSAFNRGYFYRTVLGEQTYPELSHVDIHAEAAPPKRRRMSRAATESNDVPELREGAQAAMYRHGVRVIFLDEAHHLLMGRSGTQGGTLQEQKVGQQLVRCSMMSRA